MIETYYTGTHEVSWLAKAGVPLFVSHRRLAGRKSLPRAADHWALDSGGFSELSLYGEWRTTPEQYNAAVLRYDEEIGELGWAAPQDWMCEPVMLARTGLTVADHQRRTVDNFVHLQELWGDPITSPYMPVLQGWERDDYLRCMDLYERAGIRLDHFPVVGVGSVCRRQATGEIAEVLRAIRQIDPEMPLHGFGVKVKGLKRYAHLLASADSMAWSYDARRSAPMPGHTHKNCANCMPFAMEWRARVLASLNEPPPNPDLFDAAEGWCAA